MHDDTHSVGPETFARHGVSVRPGTTLLGVWAHPDDEAYLSTGLMHRVAAAGGRVVLAFATRGEAANGAPDEALARRRVAEATEAAARAGAESPRFLGHVDGRCAAVDRDRAVRQVAELIEGVRPDVVVTFGPDGITGHPDHAAVSAWTLDACQAVGLEEVLLASMEPWFLREHAALHDAIGLFGPEGPLVTRPDDVVARVRLTDHELDLKRAVLAAHASQTDGLAALVGESTYRRWWAVESFRAPEERRERARRMRSHSRRPALTGTTRM